MAGSDDFGLRADGTPKGLGFLGEFTFTRPDGSTGVATEFSIGVDFDGKETQIPTIVPTLNRKEIDLLINDIIPNNKEIPEFIIKKAISHAKKRISDGLSPFKEEEQFAQFVPQSLFPPTVADPSDVTVNVGQGTQMEFLKLMLGLR